MDLSAIDVVLSRLNAHCTVSDSLVSDSLVKEAREQFASIRTTDPVFVIKTGDYYYCGLNPCGRKPYWRQDMASIFNSREEVDSIKFDSGPVEVKELQQVHTTFKNV